MATEHLNQAMVSALPVRMATMGMLIRETTHPVVFHPVTPNSAPYAQPGEPYGEVPNPSARPGMSNGAKMAMAAAGGVALGAGTAFAVDHAGEIAHFAEEAVEDVGDFAGDGFRDVGNFVRDIF